MNRRQPYRPLPPQIPADSLRGNPCDSRDPRSHVPPLKGLRETLTASVSYRASVPAGHAYCEVAPSHRALSPAADRQSRSFKTLSGKGSAPATPPPFRHTPGQSRPRHTAPVWRNPGRHPHRDGTFTFSAKERDSETGLSYFGSRYYSSDLSVWLSVDPMAAKYPSLSPYVYCANNPVRLVDPNGEKIKPVNATSKQYLNSYLQDQFGTSDFISYSKNGIVKIDRKAFRTLYANSNPYQKVLLNGFKKVVNSRSMVYVDIDNKKDFDYSYPVYKTTKDSEFPTYSHDEIGHHIIESGTTVESRDGYHIYINNEGAIADKMISSLPFENNQSSLSFTGGSASSIFFHELLDEVLNYHIKHKTNDLSRKREKVFYENNALENKGLKPRNGIEHQ